MMMEKDELAKAVKQLRNVQMVAVQSSQIAEIGYAEEQKILLVKFLHGGSLYAYANIIPDFWNLLLHAPSKGQFFSQRIKIHPDLFPYVKVY